MSGLLAVMAMFSPGPVMSALLLASAFALLAGNCMSNRLTTRQIREDAAKLSRSVDQLETAEGLAGYGRWCIEIEPRRHLWSEEMCHLAGLPPGTPPREDILERIMPEGMEQIETVLDAHAQDREPFAIEFEVAERGEGLHILRARARNVFSAEGVREQVFMVVKDVSETYALRRDRDEALERAAQAQREANTDALTGLANRRYTMAELDRAVMEARRDEKPLSVIVFDIDHFKQVNDRHGHPVGDKVIAMVGDIATRQAREFDIVGRIGGEEFLWILPDCKSEAALRAAERLRWAIEAGTHSAPIPSITISAGHAEIEAGDASLILFARADAALYEAKRGGRNRVAQAA
ncbi:GGDEF domain-containing protein [Qipengyuania sp. 1NDH17]|uniref:diguanylate cyclase n=1 Tax=Qipengyuania polymorpha TaxID=2867234 RepID=A0ABS7IZ79_9SPHN|nr:sensor domain-containing diguanylate cyclase [Qipengyuania polymorpha]MBX7457767.1 GGDEF domain-containing protein [Qipengyuania polymorpha]